MEATSPMPSSPGPEEGNDQEETKKSILKRFVDTYRAMPELWNITLKEYSDRDKKNEVMKPAKTLKRKKERDSSSGSSDNNDQISSPSSSKTEPEQPLNSLGSKKVTVSDLESLPSTSAFVVNPEIEENDGCHENDLGRYVGQTFHLTMERKKELLKNPESTTRRSSVPNLSRLCETRWSEKYKSIRLFAQNFPEIVKALEKLSIEGNYATRKSAYQLYSAVTKSSLIVALTVIAKYSALLEPVVNALQAKTMDLIKLQEHLNVILNVLKKNRDDADLVTDEVLKKAQDFALKLEIEISIPRTTNRQIHRSNPPSDCDSDYWKRSLIIPYLDSIIASLNIRFSQEHTPAFALTKIHPLYMLEMEINQVEKNAQYFTGFYQLNDITAEMDLWYNLWKEKKTTEDQLKGVEIIDLLDETDVFYPILKQALLILITIPCTTATVERSFSTLRRVKTWLRSTMGEERLTGLCLMSVHRDLIKSNREQFENKVLNNFAANPRKLLLK
ncbi:unnamed protein product [Brassicogethes aeneus]|uniref:HAT C-terminal dimerisation domain-containing protein n=1 Tax=Brassicogethes aeneus TaxID=1431903 RepID=A0A9P0FD59_BRAAE|nr:unnamed protein product [Brassicogethes aeneus]